MKLIKIERFTRWSVRLLTALALVHGSYTTSTKAMVAFDAAAEQAEKLAAKRVVSAETLRTEAKALAKPGSLSRPLYEQQANILMKNHGSPASGPITAEDAAALRIKIKHSPQMDEKTALRDVIWERPKPKGTQPHVVAGPTYSSSSTTYLVDPFFGPSYSYNPFFFGAEAQLGADAARGAVKAGEFVFKGGGELLKGGFDLGEKGFELIIGGIVSAGVAVYSGLVWLDHKIFGN